MISGSQTVNTTGMMPSWETMDTCWFWDGYEWRTKGGSCSNNYVTSYSTMHSLGFSIPANATITGVEFSFYSIQQGPYCDGAQSTPSYILDVGLSNGGVIGTPQAVNQLIHVAARTAADGYNACMDPAPLYTFGGPGDTWGAALTPAVVNSPNFGYAFVYQFGSRVFYTTGGAGYGNRFLFGNAANVTVYYTMSYDSASTGNNIPATFNANEAKTIGADGVNPPSVTMQNTGDLSWGWGSYATDTALGPNVGTCDIMDTYGYLAPSPTAANIGKSCTAWYMFSSWGAANPVTLQHTGSFVMNPTPIYWQKPVQVTVSVNLSPGGICGFNPLTNQPIPCPPVPYDTLPSYSAATGIDPGGSVTFPMTSLTAPGNGSYTETWQLAYGGTPFGSPLTKIFSIGAASPTVSSVSVNCTPTAIRVNQTSQCTATVNGSGNPSQSVTWSVASGGGSMNSTGSYTAPGTAGSVVVNATSTQNTLISGTTTISVSSAAQPAPTVTVTATPNTITNGNPTVISWTSTDATACSASWGGPPIGTSGSQTVRPPSTKTYTVTCTGPGGPGSGSATVTVNPRTGGPVSIQVNSSQPVAAGVRVDLSCTGGNGGYNWSSAAASPSTGNGSTYTPTYGTAGTYAVTCADNSNPGNAATTNVQVEDCTFSASPTVVVPPQQTTLSWNCPNNIATSCTLSDSQGNQLPIGGATSGTIAATPPGGTETYSLSCIANNGFGDAIPAKTAIVSSNGPGVHEIPPPQ